jgi:putative ABC transport system substrate-binding protein
MGLHLEAVEVRTPQDILFALTTLANTIDVLWGLADTLTLSPQMAKHILLFTFRNDIPFVGPSEAWTRAGALYSLDWDYKDLGAQCGDMAIQILRGKTAKAIPPASPRTIRYSVNMNTARQMRLNVPEDVVKKAWTVYRVNP